MTLPKAFLCWNPKTGAEPEHRARGLGDMCLDPKIRAEPEHRALGLGDKFLAADGFARTHTEHEYLIVEGLR